MSNVCAENTAKKPCKVADIIVGILFFAGFIFLAFLPKLLSGAAASFYDVLSSLFKDIKQIGSFGYLEFSYLAIAIFYVASLVFTVLSFFFSKKTARTFNFLKAFLGLVFFINLIVAYCHMAKSANGLINSLISPKSSLFSIGTSLALAFLYLIVLSLMQYKKAGLVKLLYFVLAGGFIAFYKFAFIGTLKLENLWDLKLNLGTGLANTISTYAYMALGFGILANLLLVILGLAIKKTGVLDYIRSIALFVIAAVCFVMLAINTKFVNIEDYLGTILSLALSAISCFAVIIVSVVRKRASKFVFDGDQMAIKGLEQPANKTEEQAKVEETSNALDDAAQISIDEITENKIAEEAAAAEQVEESAEPAAEPIEEVSEEVQGEPVETTFDFEQTQYDGNYNREYQDQQDRESAQQAQQAAQQAQQPFQQAPYVSGQGYAQQFAQTYGVPYYNGPAAVMPDAFINGLTPAEKDEFDKLFISRIYGDNKRLPMYRIGADNREFFSKVFVFIGRYRNIISDGLLEKIYIQSNLLK